MCLWGFQEAQGDGVWISVYTRLLSHVSRVKGICAWKIKSKMTSTFAVLFFAHFIIHLNLRRELARMCSGQVRNSMIPIFLFSPLFHNQIRRTTHRPTHSYTCIHTQWISSIIIVYNPSYTFIAIHHQQTQSTIIVAIAWFFITVLRQTFLSRFIIILCLFSLIESSLQNFMLLAATLFHVS